MQTGGSSYFQIKDKESQQKLGLLEGRCARQDTQAFRLARRAEELEEAMGRARARTR